MSRVRNRDTAPEVELRRALWAAGVRGWRLHPRKVPGKPDVAWIGRRIGRLRRWRLLARSSRLLLGAVGQVLGREDRAQPQARRARHRRVDRSRLDGAAVLGLRSRTASRSSAWPRSARHLGSRAARRCTEVCLGSLSGHGPWLRRFGSAPRRCDGPALCRGAAPAAAARRCRSVCAIEVIDWSWGGRSRRGSPCSAPPRAR